MVGWVLAKRTAFIFSVRTQNPEHESSRFILNVGNTEPLDFAHKEDFLCRVTFAGYQR
jgi:hypothetical protein